MPVDPPVAEPVDERGEPHAQHTAAGGAVALAYATKRSQRPGLWTAMGIVSIVLAVWMGLQALIGVGQPIVMRMMSGIQIPAGPTTTLAPATQSQDGATLSPTSREADRLPDLDATRIWVELISQDAARPDVQTLLKALRAHGAAMFPDYAAMTTTADVRNRIVGQGQTPDGSSYIELKDARIEFDQTEWSIYTRGGRLLSGTIDPPTIASNPDASNSRTAQDAGQNANAVQVDRFEDLPMGAPLPADPNAAAPAMITPFAGWALSWGMIAVQAMAQVIGLLLAGVLMWAGIQMLRDRRAGLSIHRRWAWWKIVWVLLVVMMLEPWMMAQMMGSMFAQVPGGPGAVGGSVVGPGGTTTTTTTVNFNPLPGGFSTWMAIFSALLNGIFALVYPILILVLTRLKLFKDYAMTLSR